MFPYPTVCVVATAKMNAVPKLKPESADFDRKLSEAAFKTPVFCAEYLEKAQPAELIALGEFLAQEEFAEEILQEVSA